MPCVKMHILAAMRDARDGGVPGRKVPSGFFDIRDGADGRDGRDGRDGELAEDASFLFLRRHPIVEKWEQASLGP